MNNEFFRRTYEILGRHRKNWEGGTMENEEWIVNNE